MAMNVFVEEQPDFLRFIIEGHWSKEDALQVIDLIREAADRLGKTRLLLDANNLSKPDNEMVRFYSGEHLAEALGFPFRVAAFGPQERINRFAETVARNRGAVFAIFYTESEATEWLLSGQCG